MGPAECWSWSRMLHARVHLCITIRYQMSRTSIALVTVLRGEGGDCVKLLNVRMQPSICTYVNAGVSDLPSCSRGACMRVVRHTGWVTDACHSGWSDMHAHVALRYITLLR